MGSGGTALSRSNIGSLPANIQNRIFTPELLQGKKKKPRKRGCAFLIINRNYYF
jgi:hypothetical protein